VEFSKFKRAVGNRIKQLRLDHGLTQEDMDDGEDGIPYRTIQNIESGKSNPSLRTLHRLSKRLDIDIRDLLDV
jgi:transcriptional regulator with XRE-family HTH domain